MMSVTIDPSETRRPATPTRRPGRLRMVLLSGLGLLGLAGFAAVASATLGGLAGPQYIRPNINTATAQKASEWPDLRDGVPALAPVKAAIAPPVETAALERAAPPASPALRSEVLPAALPAAVTPEPPAQSKRVETPSAVKPARLPPIENAAVLPPARPASLVSVTRNATLIAPTPNETTRSRATTGTFTALGSEREAAKPRPAATLAHANPVSAAPASTKPAPVKPIAAKPAAKPAPVAVAAASAPEPPAVAEPEHTEVFGLKVPSLAPAGRKFAEGVEALGNAVKSLPDRF